jgi:hypothetical protein
MPKDRIRAIQKGAKSVGRRTKNKIGGRKSSKGAGSMSEDEITAALDKVRKRDRNKLRRALYLRWQKDLPS